MEIINNSNDVLIDFYDGAYGATIIIAVRNHGWLLSFKRTLQLLIGGNLDSIDFSKLESVVFETEFIFKLIKVSGNLKVITKSNETSITWCQNEDQLLTLVDLVDGLLDSDCPGHQYLTHESDGILIKLTYKEI